MRMCRSPIAGRRSRDPRSTGSRARGWRHVARSALVGVHLDEEVARDPEREEVDGEAADDLVGAEMDRDERVDECQRGARDHTADDPPAPVLELVRAQEAEERAHQQHSLEADVHDSASLGQDPAERSEGQRRGSAQRRGDQRRPHEDLVEVLDVGARAEPAEQDPEHTDRDRERGEPPTGALAQGDRAGDDAEPADDERDDRRARRHGRKGEEERERSQSDAEPGEVPREVCALDAHAFDRRRADAQGGPPAHERGGMWGTGRFPIDSGRRGHVGETWFPPRERAEGERRFLLIRATPARPRSAGPAFAHR